MKIIFRADGNSQMGLGHIMRSAALMQMLQSEFHCEFWTRNPEYFPYSDFSESPIVKHLDFGDDLAEAQALVMQANSTSVFVLDGYHFKTSYQDVIKKKKFALACIDDIIVYHFLADAVINHAGGIAPNSYSCEAYTKLYLGPQYSLIRPVFYNGVRPFRDFSDTQILVSLGGADPNNITDVVLRNLVELKQYSTVHVVLGAANKNSEKLKEKYFQDDTIHFYERLSGQSMYQLMLLCPYAILPPSTICYEYMSVGGVVFLYQIADNQNRVREFFLKEQLAIDFSQINSAYDAKEIVRRQELVFDGRAPQRLRTVFRELAAKQTRLQWEN
jgi:UDP-2,4-diacetamido-2,4,6-trideoxy-beta-L-altropyranose hydrolase